MGDLSDKEECSISPSQPQSPSRNLVRCHRCSCSWPTKVVVPFSRGGLKPIKEETSVGVGDSLNLGGCFGITNLGSMAVPVDISGTTSMSGNLQLSTGGPASSLEIGTSENCAARLWWVSQWSPVLTFLERHFVQRPASYQEHLEVLH